MRNAPAPGSSTALARETRVFGLLMIEQRKVIERIVGSDGYRRVLSRLPAERREEFAGLGMFSWCRTSTVAMVITEAAQENRQDLDAFTQQVVREGFTTVMRTVWRMFMHFSSDEAIVQRAATIYTKALDRGAPKAFVESPGHLVLEVSDWPDINHIDIVALASGIEAALEVAGRRVRVMHRRMANNVVRFDVRTFAQSP